jgi:uncharacterized protein (TIGR02271 family)
MIGSDQIEAITAADVRSSDDEKVGSVGQIFLDGQTGLPEWAAVRTGFFGTKEAFVPLRNAEWDGRVVRIAYDKNRVRNAPHVEPDSRGLDPDQQVELYTYYGFTEARPGSPGGTRTGGPSQGVAGDLAGSHSGSSAASATDGGVSLSGVDSSTHDPLAGRTETVVTTTDGGAADSLLRGRDTSPGLEDADDDTAGPVPGAATGALAGSLSDDEGDATVTRMEEYLEVGVEQVATERVRLRKHVVTQQETVTVTIRREELRIEREPISADEARSLGSGDGIGDSVTEIVLYEERPVVTTVARPVERIRLTREVVAAEQTVTGDVRKERIAVEDSSVD